MLSSVSEEIAELQLLYMKEFGSTLEVIGGLKEEICNVQADVELNFITLKLEKSLIENEVEELTLELMAANEHLEKANAAKMNAETELAKSITKETTAASALCTDLDALRPKLITTRGRETKLEKMSLEVAKLRSRMTLSTEIMAIPSAPEVSAKMDTLYAELCAIKESEAHYHENVKNSQAEIEALKIQLCAFRDLEAEWKESLVATDAELQEAKDELAIANEALEWVGGDAAALSAKLESLKAEIKTAKEGEARAKADLKHCSSTLQRMRIDLEDASRLADKARAFKLDLDDVTAKLEKAIESERTMAASMVSLRAELNKSRGELAVVRENNGVAFVEKDQRHETELNQMRALLEAAVMAEAEQSTEEAEKARHEVVESRAHIETIDAKLQALLLEVEAVKASEEWAFTQMRLNTIPEYSSMETEEEQDGDISISHEYQNLKTKTRDLQELVNKRAAVGIAQVDAAKASEREMRWKVEVLEREVRACRIELNEAVNKRDEAEAALQAIRFEGKPLSFSGTLNGGNPMGKFVTGERQGNMNSIYILEDSQSSSPSCSSLSFANCASPGRQERSPVESNAQPDLTTKSSSAEKERKPKFSSKIGAYFSKKKDSTEERNPGSL
ncbi:uncharacterized protein [Physcomitrium patens]|nr:putative uncharacterized protein MYH16 [Physcomitrium patens]PNR31445.1 hypothetical protein PHYPA_025566 [Physcomitrium patens]|eukprot:XP_024358883.1 putative uncharacterized protein MYH16 [Physcomitrella patens]